MRQDAASRAEGCLTCIELRCGYACFFFLIVAICDRPLCNSRCSLRSSCSLWLSLRRYNTFDYISVFLANDDDSHQLTTGTSEPKDGALDVGGQQSGPAQGGSSQLRYGFPNSARCIYRRRSAIRFASCRRADPIQEIMRISHRDHDHTQKKKCISFLACPASAIYFLVRRMCGRHLLSFPSARITHTIS